ncbi:heavy-metal-associated domain-containing protein [Massilia sp.]|uniref:heavy-metal-associated domain-containing protein n=1 Tax=Massilia sp. TaxID=1882437 RepID=UPI00352BF1F7
MYTLKVEKMSCGGCAARVTRAVQAVDPKAKVEVLLKDRLVQVESAEAPGAIAGAITSAGYPATPATQI